MSALPNTRHELFCQYLTQGKSSARCIRGGWFRRRRGQRLHPGTPP